MTIKKKTMTTKTMINLHDLTFRRNNLTLKTIIVRHEASICNPNLRRWHALAITPSNEVFFVCTQDLRAIREHTPAYYRAYDENNYTETSPDCRNRHNECPRCLERLDLPALYEPW
jgi:hypothetical protein